MFWLAMMLQLVLAVHWDLLPIGGRFPSQYKGPRTITGFYTLDFLLAGDWEGHGSPCAIWCFPRSARARAPSPASPGSPALRW